MKTLKNETFNGDYAGAVEGSPPLPLSLSLPPSPSLFVFVVVAAFEVSLVTVKGYFGRHVASFS